MPIQGRSINKNGVTRQCRKQIDDLRNPFKNKESSDKCWDLNQDLKSREQNMVDENKKIKKELEELIMERDTQRIVLHDESKEAEKEAENLH